MVFLLVRNNKQKTKANKDDKAEQEEKVINEVEEKTLTEEEKQAKREINDNIKNSLPKEKREEKVYVFTPNPSDLKKIKCSLTRKQYEEILKQTKNKPFEKFISENFERWNKILREEWQESFFPKFPETIDEFWENYHKARKRIDEIIITATTFRKEDNEEKVDWIFENKVIKEIKEYMEGGDFPTAAKKFIEEKINPQLKEHFNQFKSCANYQKFDQWMKKYLFYYVAVWKLRQPD
ncbi:MAG: hypothetical protein mread185_000680 [Mycoplasmataceae bacterium]|nr:MAG: hypothetical protein mread185_000680 [Mycoplasmataceae bacterium]